MAIGVLHICLYIYHYTLLLYTLMHVLYCLFSLSVYHLKPVNYSFQKYGYGSASVWVWAYHDYGYGQVRGRRNSTFFHNVYRSFKGPGTTWEGVTLTSYCKL